MFRRALLIGVLLQSGCFVAREGTAVRDASGLDSGSLDAAVGRDGGPQRDGMVALDAGLDAGLSGEDAGRDAGPAASDAGFDAGAGSCPLACPCAATSCGPACTCGGSSCCGYTCSDPMCMSHCVGGGVTCAIEPDVAGRDIVVHCESGATCHVGGRNSSHTDVDCEDESVCEVDCRGSADCTVDCRAGDRPSCRLDCTGASSCTRVGCASGWSRCMSTDVWVCNHPC